MLADDVPGDEQLYRSVRPHDLNLLPGVPLSISSQAFSDRSLRISVDRASLVGFQPDRSRLSPEQAIVILMASEARAQGPIMHDSPSQSHSSSYDVGVSSDPLLDNPAHALIHLIPFEEQAITSFRKLKRLLALLVNVKLEAGEKAVDLPTGLE